MRSRNEVVKTAESWVGLKESNGSYKSIIDIYNSFSPLPRNLKMNYNWPWCACTWSAIAIKLGYTDIMPIEISCGKLIDAAKAIGAWQEKDDYTPSIGDAVLYDWDDNGLADCTGWPDHVGTVSYVNKSSGYFVVIEGNYSNSVKKRTVSINGKFIRGFITPKYDNETQDTVENLVGGKTDEEIAHEVIAGMWGNGEDRKNALESKGYDYEKIRKMVNEILNGSAVTAKDPIQEQKQPTEKTVKATCYAEFKEPSLSGTYVTTANLYCRNDAGTNKKALCLIPKGTEVKNYGFYSEFNNQKWLLISFNMDGIRYIGFSYAGYLKKIRG